MNNYQFKFKVGDRVRIIGNHPNKGCITTIEKQYYYSNTFGECYCVEGGLKNPFNNAPKVDELELMEKTMDNLGQGDILVNKDSDYGYKLKVQGTLGKIVFTCDSDDNQVRQWTVRGLKSEGWSLMGEENEVTEVTLEEIAEKMNVPVEKLRIKE